MSTTRLKKGVRSGTALGVGMCATLLLLGVGCGATSDTDLARESPALATHAEALDSANGLSVNGLSFNGLSFNGLSFNGLSFNGLSHSAFTSWFQQDPALADSVMRYLVRCAVPAGETRTYTDAETGQVYRWAGGLGLAPSWAGGAAASEREQQVISACLAAHANKYGVHVPISVLGRDAAGLTLPFTSEEKKQFGWKESCFFGNLFRGEGVYVGRDKGRLTNRESTSRACSAIASRTDEAEAPEGDDTVAPSDAAEVDDTPEALEQNRRRCTPLTYVGRCSGHCVMDASKSFYASCTHGGVTYQPITTRLRKQDIYRCGDGVCQPTESCGRGDSFDGCKADCGTCL